MRIVDVVYDDYALVHTTKTKEGVSEVLNNLYSKSAISHTTAVCAGSLWESIVCRIDGFKVEATHSVCRSHS